jgi:hypothetical protein
MWRQRVLAKTIRERETRKLLARPPDIPRQREKPGREGEQQPVRL